MKNKSYLKYAGSLAVMTLGALLYGVGVTVFINPHRVLLGGATGLATIINVLTGLPLGLMVLAINLPLLVISFLMLGKRFTLMSLGGTLLISLAMEATAWIPAFEGDRILSTLCGAALSGGGAALMCGQGMTSGGSDLAALLLQKKFPGISFGGLVLAIDGLVILAGGLLYRELETVLYSLLLAVVYTVVLDTYLKGRTAGRFAFIISEIPLEEAIMKETDHSVTILKGMGGYSREDRNVLFCALNPGEERLLRRIVYQLDPKAFMVVGEATEILGFGFQELKNEAIK